MVKVRCGFFTTTRIPPGAGKIGAVLSIYSCKKVAFVPVHDRAISSAKGRSPSPNYSVKWTAATCHGNLTLTVAAATYLKR